MYEQYESALLDRVLEFWGERETAQQRTRPMHKIGDLHVGFCWGLCSVIPSQIGPSLSQSAEEETPAVLDRTRAAGAGPCSPHVQSSQCAVHRNCLWYAAQTCHSAGSPALDRGCANRRDPSDQLDPIAFPIRALGSADLAHSDRPIAINPCLDPAICPASKTTKRGDGGSGFCRAWDERGELKRLLDGKGLAKGIAKSRAKM
jgi:hypothetical protein